MDCSRCGAKVGFLNKVMACPTCGCQVCGKCAEWEARASHGADSSSGSVEEVQMAMCSEDCAFGQYATFIKTIDPTASIVLVEDEHVGLDLEVEPEEDDTPPSFISFSKKRLDPRDNVKASSSAPDVRPFYDRVKRDLTEGRRNFREGY
jgi:hypothetical protein